MKKIGKTIFEKKISNARHLFKTQKLGSQNIQQTQPGFQGYIIVGDGCWRRNMLVTTGEYW